MNTALQSVNCRLLSSAEAEQLQLANLGLRPGSAAPDRSDPAPETIAAEIVRSVLWGLSCPNPQSSSAVLPSEQDAQSAWTPVHVTKVLNRAAAVWRTGHWAAPETADKVAVPAEQKTSDFLRQVLEDLEQIGDVVSLPRGMWLPAPVRAVHLAWLRCWLLAGGLPTVRLPQAAQAACEWRGAARFLTQPPEALNLAVPTLSSAEWLHAPEEDLAQWTRKTIESVKLDPLSGSEGFRFYAPGSRRFLSSRDNLQINRWHESVKVMRDGRCLFRNTTPFGAVRYGIAEIKAAAVVAAAYVELRDGGVRRLMYGLDAAAGCSTHCRRESGGGEYVYVLNNEVPGSERRLLTAVGRILRNDDEKYYPRRWAVPSGYAAEVEKAFARLGMAIES